MTSKHGSLSFEYSDNEYEGTQGVEWSRGNVGERIKFKHVIYWRIAVTVMYKHQLNISVQYIVSCCI